MQFYTLAGSEIILPLVDRHTQSILASKDLLAQQDSTGRQLFDALVKPAASLIDRGGRVFLIADNGLGHLNFDTLIPAGDHPHYWIEDVAITNARSLRLLSSAKARPIREASAKMLLIGNPVYRPADYPALPNAGVEVADVSSHFSIDKRTVFTGANASPATYALSNPGSFSFIHFVAHATANEINPLDSAIILSRPPGSLTDNTASYKLYARDILRLPLRADLVTLSSCYGSGTRNYSGEGVVGLVWAFLRAGAHSVIGALWEVSDVSTPQLMDNLYTQLLKGNPPDEALRSAKLTMLHSDSVFRKPLYWASFQLYAGR
ncbi:MAG: CHAT domain-containing protein [Granulicella sp.]